MVPGNYCLGKYLHSTCSFPFSNFYFRRLTLLVTELAENGGLDKILHDKKSSIMFVRKMRMAEQVASGLNWLHCQSPPLLHLDIKPANLLVHFFISILRFEFRSAFLLRAVIFLHLLPYIPDRSVSLEFELILNR
jgi:serine/threonine protein kinase